MSLWQSLKPATKPARFIKTFGFLVNMRSMREPLFDLKQVESVTKLVKLKVSFRSDK